jgi:hypothetical protein
LRVNKGLFAARIVVGMRIRAGVAIAPRHFARACPRHTGSNKITEYRKMLLAWKTQGIITIAGLHSRLPADTPDSIRRDIAIIQKELPLDIAWLRRPPEALEKGRSPGP